MSNIGVLMSGHRHGKDRDQHDFQATPPNVTMAFLNHYRDLLSPVIWEPCCGDGAMAQLLPGTVISTDLIHRGYGMGGVDFLKCPRPVKKSFDIITNPPFKHAEAIIRHAHAVGARMTALFLPARYWNVSSRLQLWRDHPPKANHPLTFRPDFTGAGNPTMDCMWVVWGDHVPFSNEPLER